jgi:ribonuclease E
MTEDPQTAQAVATTETQTDNTTPDAAENSGAAAGSTTKKKSRKRSRRKAGDPIAPAPEAMPTPGDDAPAPSDDDAETAPPAGDDHENRDDHAADGPAPSVVVKPAAKKRRRKKPTPNTQTGTRPGTRPAAAIEPAPDADEEEPATGPVCEMLINYVPGEECRIAILEDGKLEEFDSEPTEHVSRVGNIYVGKVVNVESQIQAAFVDFGVEEAGFLHISDLHPRYFPGAEEDETESVGRKTPRRQRPMIQQALKRGQEITVQVLKEGVGTKGPTLTSYLSIPGRFLVMMPDMDRVGVSRKVEDEDERRKMREILDQLDLPDGFGFILRTAGFERNKAELKRDLAYLQRLWKDMERRRRKGGGARLLYSEADLLLRTLRDRATANVSRIIVDNEAALRRASAFMKIVSPRSSTRLCHYEDRRPIFHAFGVEDQLSLMHATEVPLPSGGRLVIEQTEALVAIDVNSGKSRAARDAETNAYQTNLEAVDEICRQLRLRDLGGLVINDLIDMRSASHRKEIENRFRERLKRDRARSTILPISQFGILEMTRQRMRGSFEQQHFQTCPRCTGRGLIQRPDSVAAGALRDLASLLEHDRVGRIELVVSPVVAGALLSTRRNTLGRIERLSGKKVEVRVSETISAGRVTMYAYDLNGADLDLERLPRQRSEPRVVEWDDTDLAPATDGWAVDLEEEAETVRAEIESELKAHEEAIHEKIAHLDLPGDEDEPEGEGKKKRRRRRRRRGKGEPEGESRPDHPHAPHQPESRQPAPRPEPADADEDDDGDDDRPEGAAPPTNGDGSEGGQGGKKKRRRRRRRRGKGEGEGADRDHAADDAPRSQPAAPHAAEPAPPPASNSTPQDAPKPETTAEKKKRRSLYGAARRTLSASEKGRIAQD